MKNKEILYIDLDGVCADYDLAKKRSSGLEPESREGFFEFLPEISGAIEAVKKLNERFEIYFLSTAPWSNKFALSEKRIWVEHHFGDIAFKKLILSHNKGLLKGSYLID